MRNWHKMFDAPVFAAFAAGLYVSVFYIMTNLTMLPGSSVLVVAFVLIAPVTITVAFLSLLLRLLGKAAYAKAASVFLCAVYILILMRQPVFEIHAISELLDLLDGTTIAVVRIIYLIVPALLLGYAFRNSIIKFAVVLGAMTVASFAVNINLLADDLAGKGTDFGNEMAMSLRDITLSRKPNIYFILADGYSSFAYMKENGIDVDGFRNYLSGSGFHLYDEAFSNYHSTTEALPAMLNMDHHYYRLSHKHRSGEVMKTARVIAGGRNNLADLLRRNSYQVQYIHNWPYLLLHGCTADHCYGEKPFAGAKMVLGEIKPVAGTKRALDGILSKFNRKENKEETDHWTRRLKPYGVRRPLEDSRLEVVRLIEQNTHNSPTFQYIHLYAPTHAPDRVVGICDEAEQITQYAERVLAINTYLQQLITDIISRDPDAVIVLTGDHGPFIARKCSRWLDAGTLGDYRDRMGVIMAIRWPEWYDGRYDKRIVTIINVFKYVLAALTDDDSGILNTIVSDDVYIWGSKDILKIVGEGNVLIPPERHTRGTIGLEKPSVSHFEQRVADLDAIRQALERYYKDNDKYPVSAGFDGLYTQWGNQGSNWITGLTPAYLDNLPRDPRKVDDPEKQYYYKSNGKGYKLIGHAPEDCLRVRGKHPELIDPKRNCWAYGFWTEDAKAW